MEDSEFLEQNDIQEEITLDESSILAEDVSMDDALEDNDIDNLEGFEPELDVPLDEQLPNNSVNAFYDHNDSIYTITNHPIDRNLIVTGGGDDKAFLWDSETGATMAEYSGFEDSVSECKFNFDGEYLAIGSLNGIVKVYSGTELVCDLDCGGDLSWIDWHPRGNLLMAGEENGSIWVWNVPKGDCLFVLSGHTSKLSCGMFSCDGKAIVSGSDTEFIVWDPKTGKPVLKYDTQDSRYHQDSITCVDVHKDNCLAVTGSTDFTAKLVHLQSHKIIASYENAGDSIEAVCFSTQVPYLATASMDGRLSIWDIASSKMRGSVKSDGAGFTKVKFHEQSPLVSTSSIDNIVRIYDYRTMQCELALKGHTDAVIDFCLNEKDRKIITASDDGSSLVFPY